MPPNQPRRDDLYSLEDPPPTHAVTAKSLRDFADANAGRWVKIRRPLSPATIDHLRRQLGDDYEIADRDREDAMVDVWARFVGQNPR